MFLPRVAAETPLLLPVEDLHRADRPSLLLVEFAAHELPDVPIMVVGPYRESALADGIGLRMSFARQVVSRTLAAPR